MWLYRYSGIMVGNGTGESLIVQYVVYFILLFSSHASPLFSSVSGGLSCVLFGLSPSKNLQESSRWFSTCSHPPLPNWCCKGTKDWPWVSFSLLCPNSIPLWHCQACSGLWCCFHCSRGAWVFARTKVMLLCMSARVGVVNKSQNFGPKF